MTAVVSALHGIATSRRYQRHDRSRLLTGTLEQRSGQAAHAKRSLSDTIPNPINGNNSSQ
jgi:hypothetical protein